MRGNSTYNIYNPSCVMSIKTLLTMAFMGFFISEGFGQQSVSVDVRPSLDERLENLIDRSMIENKGVDLITTAPSASGFVFSGNEGWDASLIDEVHSIVVTIYSQTIAFSLLNDIDLISFRSDGFNVMNQLKIEKWDYIDCHQSVVVV